jgi:hypothetical protein
MQPRPGAPLILVYVACAITPPLFMVMQIRQVRAASR